MLHIADVPVSIRSFGAARIGRARALIRATCLTAVVAGVGCDDDSVGASDLGRDEGDSSADMGGDGATDLDNGDAATDSIGDVDTGETAADDTMNDPVPDDVAGDSGCPTPLDDDTLSRLTIGMESVVAMQPGDVRTFELGVVECCVFLDPVDACVIWLVEPTDGAAMDPDSGTLTLDAEVPAGSVFTVTANVESGRRLVTAEVHVWTPETHPLVGFWSEQAQIECGTGTERAPEQAIAELRFTADGRVNVTWTPFEVYVDYWGSYAYDIPTGELELTIDGGNYVPLDVDGVGTAEVEASGDLVLRDMWLGTPSGGSAAAGCGHRFR